MSDEIQAYRDEIQDRIDVAREVISDAALDEDWDRAKAVTTGVKSLEDIQKRLTEFRKEVRKTMVEFDRLTKTHSKAQHTKLHVRIDWRAAGVEHEAEFIDEDQAAETLTKFVESIVRKLGEEKLEVIGRIQNGAGGLVSRNPRADFINPSTGEQYSSRPIGSTGWHIKTHSSTKQKADEINQIKTLLAFPRRAIEVDIVQK